VLNINTGKVKKPEISTEVPMTDTFGKVVNDWGQRYNKLKERNRSNLETKTRRHMHRTTINTKKT
jgi:hypothetical protein